MVEAPMLIYHYPTTTYILDIDASNTPQVTLLSQMVEGDERVVAYYSKMFKPTPKNCCYPEWVDGGDYVPASLRYYFIYLAVHVCGVNPSGSHVAQVPSRVQFWIGAQIWHPPSMVMLMVSIAVHIFHNAQWVEMTSLQGREWLEQLSQLTISSLTTRLSMAELEQLQHCSFSMAAARVSCQEWLYQETDKQA